MPKKQGYPLVAGVDEAGRGPLAGPVIAAAVILDPERPIAGLADSKILSEKQRENLFQKIQENALAWSVGRAEVSEIDHINILQASLLAMQRAIAALTLHPELVLIDGNQLPLLSIPARAIIQGDKTEPAISAASIVAKVTRDREMVLLHETFPDYGFAKHKGYGTKEHIAAIEKFGICLMHRKYFSPVAKQLEVENK